MGKVWFVTGSSRGFGRAFVDGALERGDRVAATARDSSTLRDLVDRYGDAVLPLDVDVTDRSAVVEAVSAACAAFGRLDVVVNNAGYGLFGTVEEITEQQMRDQMETNFFGAFHVTQAVLPVLREQRSGHIVQISTIGGVAAFPMLGGYHASKWALEGLSESLASEVATFGISVTLVEPGGFDTDWNGASATFAEPNPAYESIRQARAAVAEGYVSPKPVGFAGAMAAIVDADEPPLRVFFGDFPTHFVPQLYQQRLDTWAAWAPVSRAAEGLALNMRERPST